MRRNESLIDIQQFGQKNILAKIRITNLIAEQTQLLYGTDF